MCYYLTSSNRVWLWRRYFSLAKKPKHLQVDWGHGVFRWTVTSLLCTWPVYLYDPMKALVFLYTIEQVVLPDSFFRRVIFGKECAIWQCYDVTVCCVLKYVLGLLSHKQRIQCCNLDWTWYYVFLTSLVSVRIVLQNNNKRKHCGMCHFHVSAMCHWHDGMTMTLTLNGWVI